jgi:hypothetical protein
MMVDAVMTDLRQAAVLKRQQYRRYYRYEIHRTRPLGHRVKAAHCFDEPLRWLGNTKVCDLLATLK